MVENDEVCSSEVEEFNGSGREKKSLNIGEGPGIPVEKMWTEKNWRKRKERKFVIELNAHWRPFVIPLAQWPVQNLRPGWWENLRAGKRVEGRLEEGAGFAPSRSRN